MKPTTDKFKTNKHAKQMEQDNLARKLGTEESVEIFTNSLKDSLSFNLKSEPIG